MKNVISTLSIVMASLFLPPSCILPAVSASPIVVPAFSNTANVPSLPQDAAKAKVEAPKQPVQPACTTITRLPDFKVGPTFTVYASTVTKTNTVDCGAGCNTLTVDTRAFGHGPVAVFKTTVTVDKATTMTTFACGSAASSTSTPVITTATAATAAAATTRA